MIHAWCNACMRQAYMHAYCVYSYAARQWCNVCMRQATCMLIAYIVMRQDNGAMRACVRLHACCVRNEIYAYICDMSYE